MQTSKKGRGYFGIGIFHPKTHMNIGTLWRHAQVYDADFIFTIGKRYKKEPTDTQNASLHIPLYNYKDWDDFQEHRPYNCPLVCVELANHAHTLQNSTHPERAIYLLGAEDHGLPTSITTENQTVQIEAPNPQSMNVAVAGTMVMYDRYVKSVVELP